jgi:hypothetical protein
MKFTVNNIPEPAFFFTLYADVPLAGEFLVSEDGLIKMDDAVEKNAYRMVYSYFNGEKEQTFYFPVPVGNLPADRYEVTVETITEEAFVVKIGSVDIEIAPNSLTVVNPITCPDYEPPYKATLREDWTGEYEDDVLTVSCDASYYVFDLYWASDVQANSPSTMIDLVSSDPVTYLSYGFTLDELVEYEELYNTSPYSTILPSTSLPEGDFCLFIVGFDSEGNLTGEYGTYYFSNPPTTTSEIKNTTLSKSPRTQSVRPEGLLTSHKLPLVKGPVRKR